MCFLLHFLHIDFFIYSNYNIFPPKHLERRKNMKCPKCNVEQKGPIETCSACGANLLPKKTTQDRIIALVGMLICLGAAFGFGYWNYSSGGGSIVRNFFLYFFAVAAVYCLINIFRGLSREEAFARRAKEYLKSDPEQAIADFGQAINHAKGNKVSYYYQRAQLYRQTGKIEEALQDFLLVKKVPPKERQDIKESDLDKEIQELTQKLEK
jgi:tetratricopeptide (TPR) repeat protein